MEDSNTAPQISEPNLNTLPGGENQAPPRKRSKIIYLLIGSIILFVVAASTTSAIYFSKSLSPQPTPTPTPQAPTPTPDPTTSWKKYEGNGFEFEYPSLWSLNKIEKTKTVYTMLTKGQNEIIFEWGGMGYSPTRSEPFVLGGFKTEKLIIEDENKKISGFAIKEVNNKDISIIVRVVFDTNSTDYPETLSETDQILSTFKFTE